MKASTIFLIILGVIAVVMTTLAVVMLDFNERNLGTPCEELVKKNNNNNYVPIPKRCEKGE